MILRNFLFLLIALFSPISNSGILSYNYFEGALGLYENNISEIDSDFSTGIKFNASTYLSSHRVSYYDYFFAQIGIQSIIGNSKLTGSKYSASLGYDQIINNRTSLWVSSGVNYQSLQYHHFEKSVQQAESQQENGVTSFYLYKNTEIFPSFRLGFRHQASHNIEIAPSININGNNDKSLEFTFSTRYRMLSNIYIILEADYYEESVGGLLGLGKYFN